MGYNKSYWVKALLFTISISLSLGVLIAGCGLLDRTTSSNNSEPEPRNDYHDTVDTNNLIFINYGRIDTIHITQDRIVAYIDIEFDGTSLKDSVNAIADRIPIIDTSFTSYPVYSDYYLIGIKTVLPLDSSLLLLCKDPTIIFASMAGTLPNGEVIYLLNQFIARINSFDGMESATTFLESLGLTVVDAFGPTRLFKRVSLPLGIHMNYQKLIDTAITHDEINFMTPSTISEYNIHDNTND